MPSFRKTSIVFLVCLGLSAVGTQWYMNSIGADVSIVDIFRMIFLQQPLSAISIPIVLVLLVMFILNPGSDSQKA